MTDVNVWVHSDGHKKCWSAMEKTQTINTTHVYTVLLFLLLKIIHGQLSEVGVATFKESFVSGTWRKRYEAKSSSQMLYSVCLFNFFLTKIVLPKLRKKCIVMQMQSFMGVRVDGAAEHFSTGPVWFQACETNGRTQQLCVYVCDKRRSDSLIIQSSPTGSDKWLTKDTSKCTWYKWEDVL